MYENVRRNNSIGSKTYDFTFVDVVHVAVAVIAVVVIITVLAVIAHK